jgi:hypothetical protein
LKLGLWEQVEIIINTSLMILALNMIWKEKAPNGIIIEAFFFFFFPIFQWNIKCDIPKKKKDLALK